MEKTGDEKPKYTKKKILINILMCFSVAKIFLTKTDLKKKKMKKNTN